MVYSGLHVFYKKLGSGHSTKIFLIWHENFVHFSAKSLLIGFLFFWMQNYQCGHSSTISENGVEHEET